MNDKYVMCPYDQHHMLHPIRFVLHLMKCARNHPDKKRVMCPFNNTHIMESERLVEHMDNCESRRSYEMFHSDKIPPLHSPPVPKAPPLMVCDEDWDAEPDVGTYDPIKYCQKNQIIRKAVNLAPAERRRFRMQERERFQQFGKSKERDDERDQYDKQQET